MSVLGDRFRRAAAGVADVLGLRLPGTTLVRLGHPELLLPPPPRSRPRRALPAPLGRAAVEPRPLLRDQVSAWRHGTPDPPEADYRLAELGDLRAGRLF